MVFSALSLAEVLFQATTSRDQAAAALYSAHVLRPSGSPLTSLRRARHRPDLANVMGNPQMYTHHARCLGAWGEWRSEIKGEAEGRRTFAEPLTPSAEAYKTQNTTVS